MSNCGGSMSGTKAPKIRIKSEYSRHLNPLKQFEPPYEPPCCNRIIVSRASLQGRKPTPWIFCPRKRSPTTARFLNTMLRPAIKPLCSLGSSPLSRQRSNAENPLPEGIAARAFWQPILSAATVAIITAQKPGTPIPNIVAPYGSATASLLEMKDVAHPTLMKKRSRPHSLLRSTP